MSRILLVDDECDVLDRLAAQLMRQSAGLQVQIHATTDPSAAMRYASRVEIAVAFVDAAMPAMDGIALCRMPDGRVCRVLRRKVDAGGTVTVITDVSELKLAERELARQGAALHVALDNMLYRIVASYEQRTGPDWKPKIYSEPIGECRRKFKLK